MTAAKTDAASIAAAASAPADGQQAPQGESQESLLPPLPEPTGYRYWTFGHSNRWQYSKPGSPYAPPSAEPLFTADQMRAYAIAALREGSNPTGRVPEGPRAKPEEPGGEAARPEEPAGRAPQEGLDRG